MEKNIRYAIIVVVIIVVIAIGYVFMSSGSMPVSGQIGTPVSNAQLSQLKAIAMDGVLADNVGVGSTANGGNPNYPLSINNSTALVVNGKVGVVYIGADFCPYCAINRWGLVIALMRFGNFTGLKYMQSGAHDVYASTATFTFENSSYVSDSVYFDPVETADINGNALSTPDPLQMALMKKYDKSGNIPFTVFGNKSILVGPMATPQSIQSSRLGADNSATERYELAGIAIADRKREHIHRLHLQDRACQHRKRERMQAGLCEDDQQCVMIGLIRLLSGARRSPPTASRLSGSPTRQDPWKIVQLVLLLPEIVQQLHVSPCRPLSLSC